MNTDMLLTGKDIGKKIKLRRNELNLTQKELGKLLGVTQQMVGQWERSCNKITISTLEKISAALGVPLSYFTDVLTEAVIDTNQFSPFCNSPSISEKDSNTVIYTIEQNEYSKCQKRLSYIFNQLNTAGKNKALEQIELLAKIPEYRKID